MGALASRPKIPRVRQQVVFIPQAPRSAPVVTLASTAKAEPSVSDTEAQEAAREESLLSRRRGRLGTVLTSFRGLLGQGTGAQPRKTLLGE